ncbi:helix-turn-helix domain-containing protein [Marinomonas mediterranea]|jgi:Cupin domain./Helix-turn-helix.|uniref:Cupin 2 conserved barrel domain protein n=1 Tax=Marinomonas mediterranea (strain ATCC 700492 / JCM 21426 / NBRC 103028 / MMB-1) TaxID=717774 RepID=F2JV28_MARM1|nr:XRE family transcriptional regulator [Marinomonas mediterranea]ADZ91682.1 Cupin 2 conserved barrel domain protein [Marinomonas mediterranea MMB-1]WCN09636.1 cupin domain-containing protein [Marinomonas mediterranea]WCN13725.1 cupin domain-containing protein [Marinomonas mediterranea]WCN17780.1 cupin domain-containing protein [Marinomonas mediterranea MMB-1]
MDKNAPSRHARALNEGEISEKRTSSPKLKLESYIALQVKKRRMSLDLKIADVAKIAHLSQGMVSKIENAQVSTSLDTLNRLCDAIGLSISQLFADYDRPEGGAQLTKAGQGMEVVRRGTEKGHTYQLLSYNRGEKQVYEPFLIAMDDASEVFPTFSHPGHEFIHLLEGRLQYRHGNHLYEMSPGDSLSFNSDIPHGPEVLEEVPIKLLSVIIHDSGDK